MSQVISGVVAPSGGFQNGGWYSGRQYWNGNLGAPGVIINPNQQGAGQPVSNEVIAQTNPANVAYIQQQQQQYQAAGGQIPSGGGGAPAPAAPSGGGGIPAGTFATARPAIDLNALYSKYLQDSGISDLTKQASDVTAKIASKRGELATATNNINENPFLAEANRTGRISSLTQYANDEINTHLQELSGVNDQIAKKNADIQTKLNIATNQYNIEDKAYQDNLSQFNNLLKSGALDYASGSDIANIASSTGMSTAMVESAVRASKQANTKTQAITSTDNNGNVTVAVVDLNTGQIINKQSLGQVDKSKTGGGAVSAKSQFENDKMVAPQYVGQDAGKGATLKQVLQLYTPYMNPQEIYTIYNQNSKYGPAKESASQLKALGIKK